MACFAMPHHWWLLLLLSWPNIYCLLQKILGYALEVWIFFLILVAEKCLILMEWCFCIVQDSTLTSYTCYQASDLRDCVKALHHLFRSGRNFDLPAIREKYSQHKVRQTSFLSQIKVEHILNLFSLWVFLFSSKFLGFLSLNLH